MSLFRPIGTAFGPLLRGVGRVVKRGVEVLLAPDVAELARAAFRHMPGFEPVRWILSGIKEALVRDDASDFIERGAQAFGQLKSTFNIDETTLPDRPPIFPVLGRVGDRLRRVYDVVRDIGVPGLEHLARVLDATRILAGRVRDLVTFLDPKLPGDWSQWTRDLTAYEKETGRWVDRIQRIHDRLQSIIGMIDRVLNLGRDILSPGIFRFPSVELR